MANQVSNVSHAPRQESQATNASEPAKAATTPKQRSEDSVTIRSAGKTASAAKTPKS